MRSSNKIYLAQHDRPDTYTGKLGFVLDEQTSAFKNWASKSKNPIEEIDNVPTSGFVLNKVKKGHVHEFGRTKDKVRIWDPRGFEFEITLNNFMELLLNNSMEEGGVLKGEFVYGWDDSIAKRIKLIQPNKVENFDTIIKISNDFVRRYTTTQIKKELDKKKVNIIKDDEYAILQYGYTSKSITTFIENERGGYTKNEYIKGFHECLSVETLIDKYNEILKDSCFYEDFELYIFKK